MAAIRDPDLPPSFPMPGSAQIAGGTDNHRAQPTATSQPAFTVSGPKAKNETGSSKSQSLRSVLDSPPSNAKPQPPPPPPPSSSRLQPSPSSSLMPPPSTTRHTAPSGVGGAPQTLIPGETSSKRKKVILAPGRSPLDWAKLKSSNDPLLLRQGLVRPFSAGRIPLSEVKKHKTHESAWTILNGMVYNITPYLEYHPGGEKELMRVAGRDGTKLFMLTHSWVNIDAMIDACCLGMVAMDQ